MSRRVGRVGVQDPACPNARFASTLMLPLPGVLADESGLLLEMFQMDSRKFQKISEIIEIKGVIVLLVV